MSSDPDPPGYELPLRLLLGFRVIVDALHTELAREGHPEFRPMHGFVLQAIGPAGTTASELGRRLGVSKQAAGKTVEALRRLGYLTLSADSRDARRRLIQLTDRGRDVLIRSGRIFDELRARWVERLGADRVRALEADLRAMTPPDPFRLDSPGWFGAA